MAYTLATVSVARIKMAEDVVGNGYRYAVLLT